MFYLALDFRPMVVDYQVKGSEFQPGQPAYWTDKILLNPANIPIAYDVAPDGKRIITNAALKQETERPAGNLHAVFVLNFFDELQRRLPSHR